MARDGNHLIVRSPRPAARSRWLPPTGQAGSARLGARVYRRCSGHPWPQHFMGNVEVRMLDTKVLGGEIVDGTGKARFRGDLGIRDGRIAAVGKVDDDAALVIDP